MPIQTVDAHGAVVDLTGVPARFFNPGELEVLVGLIEGHEAKIVIEIGVHEGRNPMVLLSRENAIERYFGIDVPPSYRPSKAVQAKEVPARPGILAQHDPRFELILRPQGSLDLTANDLPTADVVFIDGDHSARAVAHDTLLALQTLRPGGMVIWHDYHDLNTVDVKPVLDLLDGLGMPIRHVRGTWLCFLITA